jgi:MobA/MobL family
LGRRQSACARDADNARGGREGFGAKVTAWNRVELLKEWREHWTDLANEHLHRAGHNMHIAHRSYRDQGVELEPTSHLGKAVDEMRTRGAYTERARRLEEVRERNAEKIEAKPEIVFDNPIRRQSTFTRRDMARECFATSTTASVSET